MAWTIRARILTAVNLLVLAVGITAGWIGIQSAGRLVERRYADDAVRQAATLVGQMRLPVTDMLVARLNTILGGDLCVFDDSERPPRLVASNLGEAARAEFLRQAAGGKPPAEVRLGGTEYRVSSALTQPAAGATPYRICLLTSKRWLAREKWRAGEQILMVTVLAVAAATALGLWFSLTLARPVRTLADQVSRISRGLEEDGGGVSAGPAVETPAGAPAEIAQFADAFREMLRQLGHSREQLAKSAQLAAVGRLSASVVHEMRNPLSGIRMNAQLLAGSVPPEAAKSFTLIVREIDRMDIYLQELLALASGAGAAAGKAPPRTAVALAEPVRSVAALLAGRLRHARVEAENALPPELPPVLGDANGIRQVVLNLMLNALEAMPDGGRIRLSAEPVAASGGAPASVRFSVADGGSGVVLPEAGADIFAPFTSTRPKGTGLGLYICRQLVEGMGGRIGYENTAGGAVFWFELPAAGQGEGHAA